MKRLIVVAGPMGVGKTTACRELHRRLPRSAFLDGDWCWDLHPFTVNAQTKAMVLDNICHLLNNFLRCDACESIIFCWVIPEQAILDAILARLDLRGVGLHCFALVAEAEVLRERLRRDVECGLRDEDVILRSLAYLGKYASLDVGRLDVRAMSPAEVAAELARRCGCPVSDVEAQPNRISAGTSTEYA